MYRRAFLRMGLASISGALGSFSGAAQTFAPAIKIVFPFAAGGPGDAVSRMIAESIGAALGRAAVVENRTGADGRIGIQAVKAAQPASTSKVIEWIQKNYRADANKNSIRSMLSVAKSNEKLRRDEAGDWHTNEPA